jgi:hypothetical protein
MNTFGMLQKKKVPASPFSLKNQVEVVIFTPKEKR